MANILLVEDSQTEVRAFTQLLKKNGHEVTTAGNGEHGVQKAMENLPDLILMDVVMPGLNGFQATRQITRNDATNHIPGVISSTKDQETDRVWGTRQGATAFLTKPVPEKLLIDTINQALAG
jgi:twitching motility two-component system response regulator PilH